MSELLKAIQWTDEHIPDQSGKIFVITGANSGIGLEAARLIGYKGGKIIMACRSKEKAVQAIDDLVNGVNEPYYKSTPSPIKVNRENLDFIQLDLADLVSIDKCAKELAERYPKIDALILNAGIMVPDTRLETAQGFEGQMGANVFGHYAFACQVAPLLQNSVKEGAPKPRMVWVSSGLHKQATGINFEDIDWKNSYPKWQIYSESKLGNILLMRKFAELYPQFIVNGCHPGYSATNLQHGLLMSIANYLLAQSAMMGSLPTVVAAADPNVETQAYIGPEKERYGLPIHAKTTSYAKDMALAERLFKVCEEKTKVSPPAF